MKKNILVILLLSLNVCLAQVGIGTTNPAASSILDVSSTSKGVMLPKVSLMNINVTSLDGGATIVEEGLMVYNTNPSTVGGNGKGYYFYDGTSWEKMGGAAPSSGDEFGKVPIGSIIGWHGSLSGVGALPDGWVLCNGNTINDADSPLNGRSSPNLNGNTTSTSGDTSRGRFLRGNVTSGRFQNEQTNNLRSIENDLSRSNNRTLILNQNGSVGVLGTEFETRDSIEFRLRGVETRVTNMTVIWIMRTK